MNTFARNQYAGPALMASAIISLSLLSACGGSGSLPVANNGGFGKGNFSGTYVLAISGAAVNVSQGTESPLAIAGTITADGNGNITGGTVDIIDGEIGIGVFTAQPVSASSYTVTADGRGRGTLVTPEGTFGLDFVLTSNSHGLITRFDNSGTGSGTLDLQSSAAQSSLTSLAFSLSGADAGGSPLGAAGAVTLNASGDITAGTEDINDNGISSASGVAGLPLSGSLVLNSGTAGTAQLVSSFGSLGFDVWVIDSTHLKVIETDNSGLALSGDVFPQQTTFTAGELVYTLSGLDSSLANPVVVGGLVLTDANGNLSGGIEDYNDSGTTNTVSGFIGSCATSVAGRCQLSLTGFSNGTAQAFTFAAYPSGGGVLLLEDDSHGGLQGTAYNQTATSFAASAGYGLDLSGVNFSSGLEVDDVAQFNASTAATNNMTGVLDENDLGSNPISTLSLVGTYTPDAPATGRGSILVSGIGTLNGGLSLEYYVVSPSTIILIEGDSGQVAMGTFELQNATGAAALAQSHMSIVRSVVRPHGAKQRR